MLTYKHKYRLFLMINDINYISNSIDQVIAQAEHLLLTGHSKLTPIYKIKTIFTNKPLDLNDIKEIEQQANKIRVFTQN